MHYILIESRIQDGNTPDEMNQSFTLVGPFTDGDVSQEFCDREEFKDFSEFPRVMSITPVTPEEAIAALSSEDDEDAPAYAGA